MAIIRKASAKDNYTKIDNFVARDENINDYSFRLYVFMAGFKNGFQLNDMYIAKALGWSRDKVTRGKRTLVEADLILVDKVDRSTYFLYIGTSKVSATNVKFHWNKLEVNPEDETPIEYKQEKLEYDGV